MEIHSDFLSTCLNDCMLSSEELLASVKRLLGVCSTYAEVHDRHEAVDNDDVAEREEFAEKVAEIDLDFDSKLITLLDKIAQIGRENYNERILNILNRLNFNGFYSTKGLDRFGVGGAEGMVAGGDAS